MVWHHHRIYLLLLLLYSYTYLESFFFPLNQQGRIRFCPLILDFDEK